MSRHTQDPRDIYGSRYLPDPRTLNNRTAPTYPPSYASSTANSDGWRGRRPFEESLPYEGEYGLQSSNPLTLPPIDGSRQSRSLGDRDTARSVQDAHHFNRPEERASERHAPTAYGFRETRGSEGRGSGKPGEGGKSPARELDFEDLFAD